MLVYLLTCDLSSDTFNLYFFFTDPATTEIYTLSLHDALPICFRPSARRIAACRSASAGFTTVACSSFRSEEHTSELQSLRHLVCRLLLEKKNKDRLSSSGLTVLDSPARLQRVRNNEDMFASQV